MAQFDQWAGFSGKNWKNSVDVRDFIQENYTPYDGDESFLEGPTEATDKLWGVFIVEGPRMAEEIPLFCYKCEHDCKQRRDKRPPCSDKH